MFCAVYSLYNLGMFIQCSGDVWSIHVHCDVCSFSWDECTIILWCKFKYFVDLLSCKAFEKLNYIVVWYTVSSKRWKYLAL